MKKLLALLLAAIMILSLAACAGTEAPPTSNTTEPTSAGTALEKGTKWNSVEGFHTEEDADSVWQYYFFDPQDSSYNAMMAFIDHDSEDIHSWYPWESSWVGVGFNNGEFCSQYGQALEQNADGPGGMISVIGFVAPADGEYVVTGKLYNAFDQDADVYSVLKEDGSLITSENYRDYIKGGYTYLTPTKVTLKAGEKIYFRPGSTNGWVSSYSILEVYYEPTDESVMVKPDSFMPVPEYPDITVDVTGALTGARDDLNKTSATEGPWVYAITSDGVHFSPLAAFIEREWDDDPEPDAMEWYLNQDDYVGIGINADVDGFLEANVSDSFENGGSAAALGYKAPADGTYSFTVFTKNVFGQNASKVVAVLDGTVVAEFPFTSYGNMKIVDVPMKAGQTVYFHGVSDGEWVSAYLNVFVNQYSAVGQFNRDSAADGTWIYASTADGKTYTPAVRFDEPTDWDADSDVDASQWYSENGTGIGFNMDMPEWMEANVNPGGGETMALGFKAPAAGKYELTIATLNAWGQNAGDVVVCVNGTDVGTVSFLDVPFGGTVTVELEEGGIVYIHGTAAGSDWVSCYLQVAVNKVG